MKVILKRGFGVFLTIALLFSLLNIYPIQVAAEPFTSLYEQQQKMDEDLSLQLNKLVEFNAISENEVQELIESDDVDENVISKLSENGDEVELLGQKKVVYALNSETKEIFEVAEASTGQDNSFAYVENDRLVVSANSPGLLYYTVVFNYLVAGKGYFTAKFVVTGTVTSVTGVGTRPTNYSLTLGSNVATTKNGSYSRLKGVTKTVKLREDVVLETQTTKTYYWQGSGYAYANYPDATYPIKDQWSDSFLLNRKGFSYPLGYKDPQSGIKLWEPPTTLVKNPRKAGSTYRDNFMKYYERNWGAPTKFTWGDVQIHHMKPLDYNGPDSMDNLIPLWKPGSTPKNGIINHSEITSWWINY